MPDSALTSEQIHRGFMAEYRFFMLINSFAGDPEWFCGASQGTTLMDLRGIDGFVWVRQKDFSFKRIPIQIKTSHAHMKEDIKDTRAVYILLNAQMPAEIMKRNSMRQIEKALSLDFEPYMLRILNHPASPAELSLMTSIQESREKANYQYLMATGANELQGSQSLYT